MGTNITKQRLESLDVLRGFDLFCLVALEGIMHPLAHAIDAPWFDYFMWNFTHMDWEGLSPWDLVMPPVYVHERCIHSVRLVALSERSSQGTSI